jgi:hypothetical protein
MKFVAANSKVSVPKAYANFVDLETTKRYIIMDFVPGSDLQKLLPSLTPAEKKKVSERIKEQIDELRSIPPPDYLGNLNAMPHTEGVLSSPDGIYNPVICGPFQDQEQMNRGILERLALSESPHYIRLLRGMVDATLQNHRTVLPMAICSQRTCSWGDERSVMMEAQTSKLLSLTGIYQAGTPSFGIFVIRLCIVDSSLIGLSSCQIFLSSIRWNIL